MNTMQIPDGYMANAKGHLIPTGGYDHIFVLEIL